MLLLLLTKSGASGQALIAGWLLVITLLNTPWRIARPTLLPLLSMSVLYFLLTAAFADGTPPNIQSHVPADSLDNLPSLADSKNYSYVLFKYSQLTSKVLVLRGAFQVFYCECDKEVVAVGSLCFLPRLCGHSISQSMLDYHISRATSQLPDAAHCSPAFHWSPSQGNRVLVAAVTSFLVDCLR